MNTQNKNLKVAVVYEHATVEFGGAENILKVLPDIFIDSKTVDLYVSIKKNVSWIKNYSNVFYSKFLNTISKKYRKILVLTPFYFDNLVLKDYDLVFSVSTFASKAVICQPKCLHIDYMLSPPRFLYPRNNDFYKKHERFFKFFLVKPFYNKIYNFLYDFDKRASLRPDYIIPISFFIKNKALNVYKDKRIKILDPIYPFFDKQKLLKKPVCENKELQQFLSKNPKFLLFVGRLVEYKKILDLAFIKNIPIVIVGDGPIFKKLKNIKDSNIFLIKNLKPENLNFLFKKAFGVIFHQKEDFGIVGLETAFFSKPIFINKNSGVYEILKDYKLSFVYKENEDLNKQLLRFFNTKFDKTYNFEKILKYDKTNFRKQIQKTIQTLKKEYYANIR